MKHEGARLIFLANIVQADMKRNFFAASPEGAVISSE